MTLSERTAIDSLLEELEDLERDPGSALPLSPSPESKNEAASSPESLEGASCSFFRTPKQQAVRGLFLESAGTAEGKQRQHLATAVGQTPTKQQLGTAVGQTPTKQQLGTAMGQTPTKLFDASASELA